MSDRRRIRKIQIQDFRGIDALELDLTDGTGAPLDLAVLAGGNGAGKTAALEAILLALGRRDAVPGALGEQIRFGKAVARITIEVSQAAASAGWQVSIVGDVLETPAASTTARLFPVVEYFSAARPLRRLPGIDGESDHRLLESNRLHELEQRLISTYYRGLRNKTPDKPGLFARLQAMWQRFDAQGRRIEVIPRDNNPGSGDIVVLCSGAPIPEDVTSLAMARNLAPTRSDIPSMVPLDALSSGQAALFAFAGPLIFRDKPVEVVLIDEPEQHLHLQWHRLLLPALRELCPDAQFIVATHSEEILDSVLSYERFILVESDDPRARVVDTGGTVDEDSAAEFA